MSAAVAGTTFRPTPTYTTLRDVTPARPQSEQPNIKWTSIASGPDPTTRAVEWDDEPNGSTERACAFLSYSEFDASGTLRSSEILIAQADFNHAPAPLARSEAVAAFKRHARAKYGCSVAFSG